MSIVQTALAAVALVQILRCSGPAHVWVCLALAVPLLRLTIDATSRRTLLSLVRTEWTALEAFTLDRSRLPWRAAAFLIVLPSVLFFLSHSRPLMTGDSKPITLTASTLVRDGTTDLSAFREEYLPVYGLEPDKLPYFCVRTRTGIHSAYHAGMSVFALPSAALARLLGVDLSKGGVQDRMEKTAASCLASACLGLFFLLALHRVDVRAAVWMTLLLALGSGLCSTVGQALWQHDGVLFWMLLALLIEFRNARYRPLTASSLQGLALAMMLACRLPSALLIAAFGLWLLARSPRRAILVGLAAVLAYAPWAWYYQTTYGHILGPSFRTRVLFTANWSETLPPLLCSFDHGLLIYQPWILLGLLSLIPSVRRALPALPSEVPGGWKTFCLAAIVPSVALVASWYCWWGGVCWGSRLLVETVPFFALLCLPVVAALRRWAWGRRLLLATLLVSAFVHLTSVYLKVDFRDCQPALIGTAPEPPGSWKHAPFLTPFVGSLHGFH